MKKETVAMLLAGGKGSRLYDLTSEIAKPAVEFGGRYRIIDFPLTNCTHSGIDTVGVLTQYEPLVLNHYVNNGSTWDLDLEDGGLHVLPPYTTSDESHWFQGTAHAIWSHIKFIDVYEPDYVLILSGDHIYNMDYSKLIDNHKKKGLDLSICVKQVPMDEASRFGIMVCDEDYNIVDFHEKPENPVSDQASMGIYVFNREVLHKYLKAENEVEETDFDFGGNIIPKVLGDGLKVGAYPFSGYWKDVGTIDSLWEANMDLLQLEDLIVNDPSWTIYSKYSSQHPALYLNGSIITQAIINEGCIISGTVNESVISYGCDIQKDSVVYKSVVQSNSIVGSNCKIEYAIVKSGTIIPNNTIIKGTPDKIKLITNESIKRGE